MPPHLSAPPRPVLRDSCPHGTWDVLRALPHPLLRPGVRGYRGYRMDLAHGRRRLEVPDACASLVFNLAGPVWVTLGTRSDARARPYTALLAGLQSRPTVGEHAGRVEGVEVLLAPWAAFGLLGVPMSDLADTMAEPADVLGRRADLLAEALHAGAGWADRFGLLDAALLGWAARAGTGPSQALREAWWELVRSRGSLHVGALARRTGWSVRRVEYLFREQVGLTPKTAARVLRFQHALRLVNGGGRPLAEVAAACGFSDQSHMNREFRAMSGRSPRRFLSERRTALPGPPGPDRVTGQVTSVVLPGR
ncbi:putative AraC-family regulatory protein [Streptomyces cirratus]|uniref:AraC-family regulatory protein n=1 Tax=Streptomyces cirratus TaxID=68187 RepID=A0ABQ3EUN0_9ACTN|nr:helix-turn-helix domain-containing protein [Streptomyces cirratus]GHB51541.1 putative AraC-family regulatory protein [Streptomyces cirratus]